jgi:hypothetical protein
MQIIKHIYFQYGILIRNSADNSLGQGVATHEEEAASKDPLGQFYYF